MAQPFPFAAIVAQEDMKKALLMAAVEPLLGGVLICPSSNDLRLFGLWKNGVSGSVSWLI